jgi:hypothetical protein
MSEEPDDHRTEITGTGEGESGHGKYRPVSLLGGPDVRINRRGDQPDTDRGESDSIGRNATQRRYGTTETERGARRYGRERRGGTQPEAPRGRDDAHQSASDRHRGRGGRPSDRRRYDSRSIQQGRSSGSPRTGSQRGSHREDGVGGRLGGQRGGGVDATGDDQESPGDGYRYGGERGGSHRDRRDGSRRGNSARQDPRRK